MSTRIEWATSLLYCWKGNNLKASGFCRRAHRVIRPYSCSAGAMAHLSNLSSWTTLHLIRASVMYLSISRIRASVVLSTSGSADGPCPCRIPIQCELLGVHCTPTRSSAQARFLPRHELGAVKDPQNSTFRLWSTCTKPGVEIRSPGYGTVQGGRDVYTNSSSGTRSKCNT